MTVTEDEVEVAVERMSLAVSSTLLSSPSAAAKASFNQFIKSSQKSSPHLPKSRSMVTLCYGGSGWLEVTTGDHYNAGCAIV